MDCHMHSSSPLRRRSRAASCCTVLCEEGKQSLNLEGRRGGHDDGDDDGKDTKSRREDLDNQNLNEESAILRIGKCASTSADAHTHPASCEGHTQD